MRKGKRLVLNIEGENALALATTIRDYATGEAQKIGIDIFITIEEINFV